MVNNIPVLLVMAHALTFGVKCLTHFLHFKFFLYLNFTHLVTERVFVWKSYGEVGYGRLAVCQATPTSETDDCSWMIFWITIHYLFPTAYLLREVTIVNSVNLNDVNFGIYLWQENCNAPNNMCCGAVQLKLDAGWKVDKYLCWFLVLHCPASSLGHHLKKLHIWNQQSIYLICTNYTKKPTYLPLLADCW